LIDDACPPRPGEELDADKLAAYLGEGPVSILQFPGGHSNLTYLVTAGGREYVLRRPPFGSKVKSAHDMGREVRVLSHLAPIWPLAPRPIRFCEDESVLGAKFYLMERIRGAIIRRELPEGIDPRALCESFVDTLVSLHAIDWHAAGLEGWGNPEGYVERQVTGWTKRWHDARTDEIPEIDAVAAWLAAHLPVSGPATIIHNDFKIDNLVLDDRDPNRIIGILDWEMSTIGDPLADFGWMLSYWPDPDDKAGNVMTSMSTDDGWLTRREMLDLYEERTGRVMREFPFYQAFALFKLAIIMEGSYSRFVRGQADDPLFAGMKERVPALADAAWSVCKSVRT
jgi:aminoglycoside phosphotransferase (APT) family kinase protein